MLNGVNNEKGKRKLFPANIDPPNNSNLSKRSAALL